MDKEMLENEEMEIDREISAAAEEDISEEMVGDPNIEELSCEDEWVAIRKTSKDAPGETEDRPESAEEQADESETEPEEIAAESLEMQAEIEVIPEEKIKPYTEVVEEADEPSAQLMAKEAKRARREARREAKENELDREDDGSVFKSPGFRKVWNVISLILLILSIGLPVGLLLYIILHFFL